jgi:hypothetical protein
MQIALEKLGDHHPIRAKHILEDMPDLVYIRGLIPLFITDEELLWYYDRHVREDLNEPAVRIRFLILMNHFVRIRTDPQFLLAEAVNVHRITGTTHKRQRTVQLTKLAEEVGCFGEESLAPDALKFMEWWAKCKRKNKIPMKDHKGLRIVLKTRSTPAQYFTRFSPELFTCEEAAGRYARDHFRLKYLKLLEDE